MTPSESRANAKQERAWLTAFDAAKVAAFAEMVAGYNMTFHNDEERLVNGQNNWESGLAEFYNKIVPAGEAIPRAEAARIYDAHMRSQLTSIPLAASYSLEIYHARMSWESRVPAQDFAIEAEAAAA